MRNDGSRLRRVHCRRATLAALAGISKCLLGCAFRDTDALQTNGEPRAIHHREHAAHPGILFTDEKSDGASGVAEHHRTSRRAVNSKLVLDRVRAHVVARAERTVGPQQEFGNEKQRNPARARRGIGQPSQYEMDDVLSEIVFAEGDEDLLSLDSIRTVSGAFGAGAQRTNVGTGLRLGELHRAHPFAAHELVQIGTLECFAAMSVKRIDGGHCEHGTVGKSH
jgi:hypothetical protein